MKKKRIISVFGVVALVISLGFTTSNYSPEKFTMPDNVKAVVEKSCFACHGSSSKNKFAKMKLDFKKMDKRSTIKLISAYTKIGDVVEKDKMPPKKFIKKFPDKKLTEAEKKLLVDWSRKEAETLVKTSNR